MTPYPSIAYRLRVLVAALAILASPLSAQTLKLRFLDVGQADAAGLVTPEGKKVLIDAGAGGLPLMSYLRAMRFDTVDLVVASHAHADHIGGMPDVFAGAVVRSYLDNGLHHTTATYQRTLAAVAASDARYFQPTARTITVGSVTLRVLPPPPGASDQNGASVGLLLEYGAFRALFTGDSDLQELEYWLARDSIPSVQVLKVAHHGSGNGTSEAWARWTRPAVAVISVGGNNAYGHPAPYVVATWEAVGATVYRTDRDGTIDVDARSDGTFYVTTGVVVDASDTTTAGAAADRQVVPGAPANSAAPRVCCKVCTRGKACGNTCIRKSYQCRQPPGCACDARPEGTCED